MNVAVIFGGESCEHDISIITGEQLIKNLNEYLYNIVPIYIDKSGQWLTGEVLSDIEKFNDGVSKYKPCCFIPNDPHLYVQKAKKFKRGLKIDVAFVCLHGLNGEDGMVAAVLEMSKIPYSSSEMCASSICIDKSVFKLFAKSLGVNVVQGVTITENKYILDRSEVMRLIEEIGYPVIVKPTRLGSSIGIEVCRDKNLLDDCLKKAFKYDKKVIIEKFLNIDKEVNIAVFEDKGELILSNTEEPIFKDELLSFDDKYLKNVGGFETIKRIVPARIEQNQFVDICNIVSRVYVALGMFGIVRFDFLVSDGVVYLNEVNTVPGSLANYLFDKEKFNYAKLIEMIISNAIFRRKKRDDVLKSFDTDVLLKGVCSLKK